MGMVRAACEILVGDERRWREARSLVCCVCVVRSRPKEGSPMRNFECEPNPRDERSNAPKLPTERELVFLDDALLTDDDHFFTTLEALVEYGSGPLIMVR